MEAYTNSIAAINKTRIKGSPILPIFNKNTDSKKCATSTYARTKQNTMSKTIPQKMNIY